MTPNTPAGGAVASPVGYLSGRKFYAAGSREGEAIRDLCTPLYTQPPATVPADAVLALVEKWRADASDHWERCASRADAMEKCADQLAQLIGDTHA